jgi:diguanylate cyclase (GGDEF)-like protein
MTDGRGRDRALQWIRQGGDFPMTESTNIPADLAGNGGRKDEAGDAGGPWGVPVAGIVIPPVAPPNWELDALRCEAAFLRECNRQLVADNEAKALLLARARERADALERMSVEDALTGLCNRRYFDGRLGGECERAWRYETPLSVAFADLDGFKAINDRHSHAVGDAVLREVAGLLRALLRRSDLAARYGGDEFAILFPQTTRAAARVACEKIRQRVQAHPWDRIAPGLSVTLSIGLTDDLATPSAAQFLAAADRLLYQAKREGRNQVH